MKKRLLFLLSVCTLFLGIKANAQSLLWKVTDPNSGNSSYLFGTYHLVGSAYLDEYPTLRQAYEESSAVVVETQLDSTSNMQLMFAASMQESLRSLVDSAEYQLLKRELEPILGVDLMMLDNFKPMLLSASYAVVLAQEAMEGKLQNLGQPIDQFFADEAQHQGKEVVSLESVQEQANLLFNSSTPQEQADELVEMLQNKEEAVEITQELLQAYKVQDLQKMQQLGDEWAQEFGGMEELLDKRNQNWMPKLKEELTKRSVFVAVGAMHLTGDNGLINLLRKSGFEVSEVKY